MLSSIRSRYDHEARMAMNVHTHACCWYDARGALSSSRLCRAFAKERRKPGHRQLRRATTSGSGPAGRQYYIHAPLELKCLKPAFSKAARERSSDVLSLDLRVNLETSAMLSFIAPAENLSTASADKCKSEPTAAAAFRSAENNSLQRTYCSTSQIRLLSTQQ